MGKTEGNMITFEDSPEDIFGKVMSWNDSLISKGFELCTYVPMDTIESLQKKIIKGENPKDIKMKLAYEIVKLYHGEKLANTAQNNFINIFQKKEIPDLVEEIKGKGKLLDILVENKITGSISATRRLFDAGAISNMTDNIKLSQKDFVKNNHVYKIGKHKFIKIIS